MKSKVIITANSSKDAVNAKRLIEAFSVQNQLLLYVKDTAAYTKGSILFSVSITQIMTQVIEYANGLILYFYCIASALKEILHIEYNINYLVKPEPIEIKEGIRINF